MIFRCFEYSLSLFSRFSVIISGIHVILQVVQSVQSDHSEFCVPEPGSNLVSVLKSIMYKYFKFKSGLIAFYKIMLKNYFVTFALGFIYTFIVSLAFMAGAASRAGDADSSRAPGLTSGLLGSVNVHRGTLLLVPQ